MATTTQIFKIRYKETAKEIKRNKLSGKVHKLTLAARLQWKNTLKVLKERIFEPIFFLSF